MRFSHYCEWNEDICEIEKWNRKYKGSNLVNQIRIENVELVSLHNLRRRIVDIVVSLVILVPLEAGVNAVEVAGLARPTKWSKVDEFMKLVT